MKVAVIGCGSIAKNQHLPALSKMENVEIKYVADIIEERAKKAKENFNAKNYLTDYKKILDDEEIEGVFVCTPNYCHDTIAIDFLNHGKNVFCEKPIALNYEKALKMKEIADKNNKILNIGVCNRYNKSIEYIKNYIDQGKLGEVYHTYCSFRSSRCIPGLGGDFTNKSISGGGVLIDWGVHFFDLILYCIEMPQITTVSANSYSKLGADIGKYIYKFMWAGPEKKDGINNVEEFITGFIRTEGASITFNGAWAQNIFKDEMFIDFLGTKGGIRLKYGGMFEFYTDTDGILQTIIPDYDLNNMYYDEDKAFLDCIKSQEKTRSNIDNVLILAKLLDALYLSSDKKEEIIL